MQTFTGSFSSSLCESVFDFVDWLRAYPLSRGFQPEEIPVAMFSQRLIGIMAHYREAMRKSPFCQNLPSGY